VYSGIKAGVMGMTRAAAVDLGAVAGDVALVFEPLDAPPGGRGRQADPAGQWAYQTQSDLTGDEAVFEAYVAADDGSVLAATAPVVVVLGE
jgi:hypothetical protein